MQKSPRWQTQARLALGRVTLTVHNPRLRPHVSIVCLYQDVGTFLKVIIIIPSAHASPINVKNGTLKYATRMC